METTKTAPILTPEDATSALHYLRSCQLSAEIESALADAENDGEVNFDSFATVGFGDYVSADDARADFVEKLIEDIIDREELYDHDPDGYHVSDYYGEVIDFADDCGYRKEV